MPREGDRNSRKYDTADCISWYVTNRARGASASADENGDLPSTEESDRRWRRARARLKEVELREERGQLIRFEEVKELVLEVATRIRSRLLNLPGRRIHELVAATDEAEVQRIRDEAVREVLEELEQEFAKMADEEQSN